MQKSITVKTVFVMPFVHFSPFSRLHPLFRVSAGSTPALPSQRAVEGLQPHGKTRGQRLPHPDGPVLLHTDSSHGCGTAFRPFSTFQSPAHVFANIATHGPSQ